MRAIMGMATAGLVMAGFAGSLGAQVLTSVPDNAIVFVRVKNLEDVSRKLGGLMQEWGLAAQQPMLADPLAALQGMGNLQQGLNKGGEAALVYFNPMTAPQQDGGEPYLIMLPVSDYNAFLQNFEGAQVNGAIAEVTLPMDGENAFVTKWGNFAAISPTRQLVAQRPQASKPTGLTATQLVERDVTAYINFNGFRDLATGSLGFGRMMATSQLDQQANTNPQQSKYIPVAKAALGQVFNGLEHFLNETQAMTFGADFSAEGVKITTMAEFMPDSYIGKFVTQWKTPETTLGTGLPEGQYAVIGTTALDSDTLSKLIDDAAAPVLAEAQKLGPDAKPVIDYVDAMKDLWAAAKVQHFGLSPAQGKPGEAPLFEMVTTMEGNAKGVIEAQSRIASLQNEFTKMVQMQGQPTSAIEVQKSAKTVNGVAFDQMTTTFQAGQGVGAQQNQQLMEMLYGKGGFTMLVGQVDDSTVVATTSKDDAAISKAIEAAKSDKSLVADQAQTKQVAAQLPKSPVISFYVYGDRFMGLVSRASEAFAGTPIQTQLPAGTPPLGFSMSTEGSAVRADYFVPSPLVKAIMTTAMQQQVEQEKRQDQGGEL